MQRQEQDRIIFESALAKAMLEEVQSNQGIKATLIKITNKLRADVLPFAIKTMNETDQFNDVNNPMKEVLCKWAIKHSKEDAFLGALLPHYSQGELVNTSSGRSQLLTAIDKHLSIENIKKINTLNEVISFIKTIDDMGSYYYSEAMLKSNLSEYEILNNMIFPTKEELDMRFERPEIMLAVTYGIGTALNKDLVAKEKDVEGCFSGKAKFFIPATENRFEMLINQFDKASSDNDATAKNALANKLNYYGISLNKDSRESVASYAKRKTAWFEKLSIDPKTGTLPLIASTSASTSRLLIMLLHLGAFNKPDGSFDLDMAQITANCFMGYFVFCGHHSFLEVIEIWNRLLDYVVLFHANTLPKNIFPVVEETLPYAKIGDYHSFLHRDYADILMDRANKHAKMIAKSYVKLSLFCTTANGDAKKFTVSENEAVMDAKANKFVTLLPG